VLLRGGSGMIFPCGGGGVCGKCRVKILSGKQKITAQDKDKIDKTELKQGWRLACGMVLKNSVEVYIPHENVLRDKKIRFPEKGGRSGIFEFALIDAGSSTVKAVLVDSLGRPGKVFSAVNPQIKISPDIIGRIGFALRNENNYKFLRNLLAEGINNALKEALIGSGNVSSSINRGLVAGNSFVTALLKEEPLDGLSAAPFDCGVRGSKEIRKAGFFRVGPVFTLPVIGGFVGGDAFAECYYLKKTSKGKNTILIDIGTNAEIIVCYKGAYFAASASAGPAFEGAGMSCGFPMVEGAVKEIRFRSTKKYLHEGKTRYGFTVSSEGDSPPAGICGTGYLSAMAEFLRNGLVDMTGRIKKEKDEIRIADNIYINQKDIRMFQNAKAAIGAGVRLMLKEIKAGYDAFEEVLVSGAFGSNVSIDDFYDTGIISRKFRKVKAADDLVLKGMFEIAAAKDGMAGLDSFAKKVKRLNLAENREFMDYYTGAMNFEK
ncbi:MAG: ASKHA domain-containing protein, partial [bacterium]|nr:ASKHA domain-containing protein [bacterium]